MRPCQRICSKNQAVFVVLEGATTQRIVQREGLLSVGTPLHGEARLPHPQGRCSPSISATPWERILFVQRLPSVGQLEKLVYTTARPRRHGLCLRK